MRPTKTSCADTRTRIVPWTSIKSPDEPRVVSPPLCGDFSRTVFDGKRAGRYVIGELPDLPLNGELLDPAVCSHFLFCIDIFDFRFFINAQLKKCAVLLKRAFFLFLLNFVIRAASRSIVP